MFTVHYQSLSTDSNTRIVRGDCFLFSYRNRKTLDSLKSLYHKVVCKIGLIFLARWVKKGHICLARWVIFIG